MGLVYFYRFCEWLNALVLGIQWNFLVASKYAEYGNVIDLFTAEPGCRKNHVDYIFTTKASLLCDEPSAATILSDLKYSISTLNCNTVLPMILCCFYCIHFEIWYIYCWEINADNTAVTKELIYTLQWRHNERDGVSNHQPYDCLLMRLFRSRSEKTSNPLVTVLCEGNSPVTGEFPAQRANNAENVSIWWRHHANIHYEMKLFYMCVDQHCSM